MESTTQENESSKVRIASGITIDRTAKEHSGRVTKVIYADESKHFYIAVIGGVTCKGVFSSITRNGLYKLTGNFQFDKKRQDWQFVVEKAEKNTSDLLGIKEYLYREAPGLGIPTITKILAKFGPQTLDIIRNEPQKLLQIPGITDQKAVSLQSWYKGQESNSRIKERLYEIGLLPSQVSKLIGHYGNYAEDKIRKDCFTLTAIHGFGFKTVDSIAELIGIPKTDPGRIKCATLYSLNKLYDEGHTVIAASQIIRETCALLNISKDYVEPCLETLIQDGDIVSSEDDFEKYCESRGIIV